MWTSCAALRLIRMTVQSRAWTAAKPITSAGAAWRSDADATSHAASRRRLGRRRVRKAAGQIEAVAISLVPSFRSSGTSNRRHLWVARFSRRWNQHGVKKPRQNAVIWLPHGNANAIPRPMTSIPISNIRNFAIVAHIDHGKSTLADRLIQMTGGLTDREMAGKEQVLDSMDIERERGITIKAQTVRLNYHARDGKDYIFNLMDTPGHVDFAYEVSRSLAACEGSLLVVDASQGVEAQTLANVYHALDAGHKIVPVLNKVDLPAAEPEKVKQQIEDVIGLDAADAILISAKTGLNVAEVLEAIVTRLPPPKGDAAAPLKALLVDSWYDAYLGVVVLFRVVDGVLKKGQRIRMMGTDASYEVDRVGVFTPKRVELGELGPGEIGFLTASIKEVADTRVGDTITDDKKPVAAPLT